MKTTFVTALGDGLADILDTDDLAYLIGEDIQDPYGGAFRVTKGLSTRFPAKVIPTPMSEAGFTGLGVGMALGGLHPIVEIMFGDFLTLAMDQMVNHASKFVGLYGSEMHLVLRAPMGGHRGYGATHSQSLERLYCGHPHITVVASSVATHPGRLLKEAVSVPNPVLFIENKLDYARPLLDEADVSSGFVISRSAAQFPDSCVSLKDGGQPEAVVLTYGGCAALALEAQWELFMNDEREVRTIVLARLDEIDWGFVLDSIGPCRRILLTEEGIAEFGWGSHVARLLGEKGITGRVRVCGADRRVIGASAESEEAHLVTKDRIRGELAALLAE